MVNSNQTVSPRTLVQHWKEGETERTIEISAPQQGPKIG